MTAPSSQRPSEQTQAATGDPGAAPQPPETCVLDAGARFEGLLSFRGEARLEGEMEGEIVASGRLWLGEASRVKARIEVDEVVIAGTLEGDVEARSRIELLATACVTGNLRAPKLACADGAVMQGQFRAGSFPGTPESDP